MTRLTKEEQEELKALRQQNEDMDKHISDSAGVEELAEEDSQEERVSKYPGMLAGMYSGAKMAPTFVHPVANFISKGVVGALGGVLGSEVTGPYVKPYTDAIYDALSDPKNKQVIPLGDDFSQGQSLIGSPSVIDNTLVPYETWDSSSTGVMNYAPQLR